MGLTEVTCTQILIVSNKKDGKQEGLLLKEHKIKNRYYHIKNR